MLGNPRPVLFLDDSEERIKTFKEYCPHAHIVTTAHECIRAIDSQHWDFVYLDHDLGGETYVDSGREDCGFEVVRHILKTKPSIKRIIVHSHNTPAAQRMADALTCAGYKTIQRWFILLNFGLIKRASFIWRNYVRNNRRSSD